jgi:FAD/FMN-containing dehydrogenase
MLDKAIEQFHTVLRHYNVLGAADAVVPRSRIAELIAGARAKADAYGVTLVAFGHAGDGNLHLYLLEKDAAIDENKTKELMGEIFKIGIALGGTISGEHGLGLSKKAFLPLAADKSLLELMRRIKLAFDPGNIMNPGKVLDM